MHTILVAHASLVAHGGAGLGFVVLTWLPSTNASFDYGTRLMERAGIDVRRIDPPWRVPDFGGITFIKFALWGLTEFETVAYLDADIMPHPDFVNIYFGGAAHVIEPDALGDTDNAPTMAALLAGFNLSASSAHVPLFYGACKGSWQHNFRFINGGFLLVHPNEKDAKIAMQLATYVRAQAESVSGNSAENYLSRSVPVDVLGTTVEAFAGNEQGLMASLFILQEALVFCRRSSELTLYRRGVVVDKARFRPFHFEWGFTHFAGKHKPSNVCFHDNTLNDAGTRVDTHVRRELLYGFQQWAKHHAKLKAENRAYADMFAGTLDDRCMAPPPLQQVSPESSWLSGYRPPLPGERPVGNSAASTEARACADEALAGAERSLRLSLSPPQTPRTMPAAPRLARLAPTAPRQQERKVAVAWVYACVRRAKGVSRPSVGASGGGSGADPPFSVAACRACRAEFLQTTLVAHAFLLDHGAKDLADFVVLHWLPEVAAAPAAVASKAEFTAVPSAGADAGAEAPGPPLPFDFGLGLLARRGVKLQAVAPPWQERTAGAVGFLKVALWGLLRYDLVAHLEPGAMPQPGFTAAYLGHAQELGSQQRRARTQRGRGESDLAAFVRSSEILAGSGNRSSSGGSSSRSNSNSRGEPGSGDKGDAAPHAVFFGECSGDWRRNSKFISGAFVLLRPSAKDYAALLAAATELRAAAECRLWVTPGLTGRQPLHAEASLFGLREVVFTGHERGLLAAHFFASAAGALVLCEPTAELVRFANGSAVGKRPAPHVARKGFSSHAGDGRLDLVCTEGWAGSGGGPAATGGGAGRGRHHALHRGGSSGSGSDSGGARNHDPRLAWALYHAELQAAEPQYRAMFPANASALCGGGGGGSGGSAGRLGLETGPSSSSSSSSSSTGSHSSGLTGGVRPAGSGRGRLGKKQEQEQQRNQQLRQQHKRGRGGGLKHSALMLRAP